MTGGAALPRISLERRAAMRAPRRPPPKVNWWALLVIALVELAVLVWHGLP